MEVQVYWLKNSPFLIFFCNVRFNGLFRTDFASDIRHFRFTHIWSK